MALSQNAIYAYNFFLRNGFSPVQSAGIVGGLMAESGANLNPSIRNPNGGARGTAQWLSADRVAGLERFAAARGTTWEDFDTQLNYILHEFNTTETRARDNLRAATTFDQAAGAFLGYERPEGFSWENPQGAHDYSRRLENAQQFAGYAGTGGDLTATPVEQTSLMPGQEPATPPAPTYAFLSDGLLSPQISYDDIYPITRNPNPLEQRDARAAEAARQESLSVGLWDAAGMAISQQWTSSWLFNGDSAYAEDPSYLLNEERMTALTQDLPENYWSMFENARSDEHAQFLRNYALEDMHKSEVLGSMGVTGTALSIAAAFLDPTAIAIGLGTGGIGGVAAKGAQMGRLATRLTSTVAGAAGEIGYEGLGLATGNPNSTTSDLLFGAALGAGLGFAFSPRVGNPLIRNEADAMARAASNLTRSPGAGSAGAARTSPDDLFLTDEALNRLADTDAAETAFGGARYDLGGALGSSDLNLTRHAAGLVNDAVGKKNGAVNPISASEERTLFFRRWMTDWARTVRPAYDEWAKAQGLGRIARNREANRQRFFTEASRFVRNRDPAVTFDPHVAKAGQKWRQLMSQLRQDQQNPFAREGMVGRSVAGFETVADDVNYVPRIADQASVNDAVQKFGQRNVENLVEGAIIKGQPDIDPTIARKLARAWVKRHRERYAGIDDDVVRAFLGGDMASLKRILDEDTSLDATEVESIIATLSRPFNQSDKGDVTHGKHRIFMDETYEADFPLHSVSGVATPGKLRLDDLFVNDLNHLANHYFRHAAGNVALARYRARDVDGNLVIDGFTNDAEFGQYLKAIKRSAGDRDTGDGKLIAQAEKDVERLQFAYNHIKGRPPPEDMKKYAEWLRLARKFNLLRLGGQFGWAQANEVANIMSQVGIKAALSQMPAFRRIRNMHGDSILKSGLADELESIFGIGSDRLTGVLTSKWMNEMGGSTPDGSTKLLRRLNEGLEAGGRGIMDVSGMRPITMLQQRWAAAAIAQKFTNMAFKPTSANLKRMAQIGLDEKMLNRVLEQIRKHTDTTDGMIFKRKVQTMGLAKWDDMEARAAFENGLSRYVSRVIQENDIGNLAKWMSHPLGQMLVQFRTFMLSAYTKQFLHNIHMRDWESFVYFTTATVWSGVTYSAWTQVKALGRDDAEEFREKNLSASAIARAAISRAGFTSIIPMLTDTLVTTAGFDPVFDFRTTGQAQSAWLGNPTTGLIFDDSKGFLGGIINPLVEGRERTQDEWRDILRIAPFQNAMPIMQIFNGMISGAPR